MATFLKIGQALSGVDLPNIAGYTPPVGAPGYDMRFRGDTGYADLAAEATITTGWTNDVGDVDLDVVAVAPKIELKFGHKAVVCPSNSGSSLKSSTGVSGARSVALVVDGAGSLFRELFMVSGWQVRGYQGSGYQIGTMSSANSWTSKASTPLDSSTAGPHVVVATCDPVAGTMTIQAAKAGTTATEGTAASVVISDPSRVPTAGGTYSQALLEIVSWPRILSSTERADVLATLLAEYS